LDLAATMNLTDDNVSAGISPEDLRKKPWKYIGYRGFSKFIASDNDFFYFPVVSVN
jgi:hypothetical protein